MRARVRGVAEGGRIRISLRGQCPDGFFKGFFLEAPGLENGYEVMDYDSGKGEIVLGKPLARQLQPGELLILQFPGEAPELGARLLTATGGDAPLPPARLRLATTRGTNALLEGKGAPTALFIDRGLADLLTIGTQQRPELFALEIKRPRPLHERVVEVDLDDERGVIEESQLREKVAQLLEDGIPNAAVALMHSYADGSGELQLAEVLRDAGMDSVVVSHDCAPFMRILPRAETTLVEAYLSPVLDHYLDRIAAAFGSEGFTVMTSSGGLLPRGSFKAKDSLFSGPAGGLVGAVSVGKRAGYDKIIGFDMGGTSTDVTRFDGSYKYQFETRVGHAHLMAPSLKIETVAAGGGSICQFDGDRLRVGPESAGAEPGPACYGTGGPLTVTDVNLLLGRMDPDQFGIPVSIAYSRSRYQRLARRLKLGKESGRDLDRLLAGLLEIADENMTDAIRKISTAEGYDPSEYALVAFGGAGGQHACAIAQNLGMETILFPGDAGLLSAVGLEQAVLEGFAEKQILEVYAEFSGMAGDLLTTLTAEAMEKLPPRHGRDAVERRCILSMRIRGQAVAMDIDWKKNRSALHDFARQYEDTFGYKPPLDRVEVVSMRVIVSIPAPGLEGENFIEGRGGIEPLKRQRVFSRMGWVGAPVYRRADLPVGCPVDGPAIIQDSFSTLFVDAGWRGLVGSHHTLRLRLSKRNLRKGMNLEAVELELFTNRFHTLVEDMGYRLQRTALSTNVKERLDFSCALLDAEGRLAVNAPHIPVHLGAMGLCLRTVSRSHCWEPGQMVATNHPGFGGSHLPDITVICPVFRDDGKLTGFLANRAHHAELGGISPGSMPPFARNLAEEGVVIPPTLVMCDGQVDLGEMERLLRSKPNPSRAVEENLADLRAQIAANLKGMRDLAALAESFGSRTVRRFMRAIQDRAERSLRRKLNNLADGRYEAEQKLDDGTRLHVVAWVKGDSLSLDFSGTDKVHVGNFHAPPGVVYSSIIYFLRVLVNEPMPLNEGLLKPVKIVLPEGLLHPFFPSDPQKCPPVVAGNVETSQRLVDTLFLAFALGACGQGTMNNLIFGNDRISYYETIAGGSGAGDGFAGESGVHVNMTNTGITDPEILEYRYPVRLKTFCLRKGSGGTGRFPGGDGVVRELEFREALTVSLIAQHRNEGPYGLMGGLPGQPGEQWLIRKDGTRHPLKASDQVEVRPGDTLRILTPGGGGWGKARQ